VALTFRQHDHSIIPGNKVVDVLIDDVMVASITASESGMGIKIISAHVVSLLEEHAVGDDRAKGELPLALRTLRLEYSPRQYFIGADGKLHFATPGGSS